MIVCWTTAFETVWSFPTCTSANDGAERLGDTHSNSFQMYKYNLERMRRDPVPVQSTEAHTWYRSEYHRGCRQASTRQPSHAKCSLWRATPEQLLVFSVKVLQAITLSTAAETNTNGKWKFTWARPGDWSLIGTNKSWRDCIALQVNLVWAMTLLRCQFASCTIY